MYGRRLGSRGMPLRWRIFCTLLGVFVSLLLLDRQIRPYIQNISAYQAKIYATKVINDAIYRELAGDSVRYQDLVLLTQNSAGEITSLQTDMLAMNRLRGRATDAVLREIASMQEQEIYLSLGTLSGVQMLSGRGPDLSLRVQPTGSLRTEIENRFDSAGINQTRHQVMLKMDMTVFALIPGYSTSTEVHTEYCLAETVIVGTVPQMYLCSGSGAAQELPLAGLGSLHKAGGTASALQRPAARGMMSVLYSAKRQGI